MTTTNLPQRIKSLRFDLNRSIRYNNKRRAFFEKWDRITNFLGLLFGSSTVVALMQQHQNLAMGLSLFLTALSALALLIGFGNKARDHLEYAQQFAQLANQLLAPVTEEQLLQIEKAMYELDAKEGEPLKVLERICYNEQCQADGFGQSHQTKIHFIQRLFAHYIDICPHRLYTK